MKNLLLVVCVMLTSLGFSQDDEDSIYYDLYYTKTERIGEHLIINKFIENEPTDEYFKKENITKWDTIASLTYISGLVIDSLNKLRVSHDLNEINHNNQFDETEYGYVEESIFDYNKRKNTPLMVLDVYYDVYDCDCYVNDIVNEISQHKEIINKVLSKRNKQLLVSVLFDKTTNNFYTYIMVKRLFTHNYYIGE
jgi:hypothetical protein